MLSLTQILKPEEAGKNQVIVIRKNQSPTTNDVIANNIL